MLLLPLSGHAMDVQLIYNRMVLANNIKALPIHVKKGVLKTCSLACTNGHEITVSEELLKLVHNEDELASVIGHEMGHATYKSELKADVLGLKYAKRAGYNYCKAAQFLKGYMKDKVHPSGAERYKNSGCP